MNLNFSNLTARDRVSKLSAIFSQQPELLYKNPYINFLREFRVKHLDLDIPELYHEGAVAWAKLTNKEKQAFRYLDVIKAVKYRQAMKAQRLKAEKKRRRARARISSHAIKRNRKKLYPLASILNKKQQKTGRHQRTRKKRQNQPKRDTERARNIFDSLRKLKIKPSRPSRSRAIRRSQRLRRRQRQRQRAQKRRGGTIARRK